MAADVSPTSDCTTLIRNKMWHTVLESRDIWRHLSKNPCSDGSKRFSNLLQNKVSSLKRGVGFFTVPLASNWIHTIRTRQCLCFLTKHNRSLLGEAVWLRRLSTGWKLLSHHHQTRDCRSSLTHHGSPPLKAAHGHKSWISKYQTPDAQLTLSEWYNNCSSKLTTPLQSLCQVTNFAMK